MSRVRQMIEEAKVGERDEYHKMDARELDKYFRETGGDPRFITADGKPIRHREVYWNNELRPCRVDFTRTDFGQHWDGWFAMESPANGTWARDSVMNGERLAYLWEGKRPVV